MTFGCFVLLCWWLSQFSSVYVFGELEDNSNLVYSGCNTLADGDYYVELGENNEIVFGTCNNGYLIIDINKDVSFSSYFSSFYEYSHTLAGPELNDFSSWREWFTISNEDSLFLPSYNCDKCMIEDDEEESSSSVYYMSNNHFCFWSANHDLTCENYDILCNQCDDLSNENWVQGTGDSCEFIVSVPDYKTESDHYMCVHQTVFSKPSIGTNGIGCVCYQDSSIIETTSTSVPSVVMDMDKTSISEFESESESGSNNNIYYLSNDDFKDATFQVKKSGTYMLVEDIVLNFNSAPPITGQEEEEEEIISVNNYEDLYWFPAPKQVDIYDDLDKFHGAYTLGFFAGITIECDNVIIDLNGFSISMDYSFYLQQRFFAIIELANRNFIVGKGATYWGSNEYYANNVVIRNGDLGLSSHHGIQGNNGNNIRIENVNIYNFEVAGIACNACNNVIVNNCNVGPQNQEIPFLGRYTQARALLPRVRYMVDNYGDLEMPFDGRGSYSVSQLADRLVQSMDRVYYYAMWKYSSNDDEAGGARGPYTPGADMIPSIEDMKLFWNNLGLLDASASYGMNFGGIGTAIGVIGASIRNTSNITINNCKVFGLGLNVIEKYRVYNMESEWVTSFIFRDTMDLELTTNDGFTMDSSNRLTSRYIGNVYEDFIYAIGEIEKNHLNNWWMFHIMNVEKNMLNWVKYGGEDNQIEIEVTCNTDIQLHSTKGPFGIRIDGVQNFMLNNVEISNIRNVGNLGSDRCGEYTSLQGTDSDIQYGYTGTDTHGIGIVYADGEISNIKIDGISSDYGIASGLTIYKGCNIILNNEFEVKNIIAGSKLGAGVEDVKLPNKIPVACDYDFDMDNSTFSIKDDFVMTTTRNDDRVSNNIGMILCDNIEMSQFNKITNNNNFENLFSKNEEKSMTILFALIFAFVIVFVFLMYHCCNYSMHGSHKSQNENAFAGGYERV